MSTTMLETWNAALFLLGSSAANTTTPSNEATRALNEAWRGAVKTCLEQGDFDCAKQRGALSVVEPAPAFGWTYYYAIPADSLRLVYVSQTGMQNDPLLRYAIEDGKIATDATTVYAIWISSTVIDTPGKWSSNFGNFVAATLASRCLRLNPSARDDVQLALKRANAGAQGVDAVQNPPTFRRPGQWASAARRGGSSEQGR